MDLRHTHTHTNSPKIPFQWEGTEQDGAAGNFTFSSSLSSRPAAGTTLRLSSPKMLAVRLTLLASCLCTVHVVVVDAGRLAFREGQMGRMSLAGGRAQIQSKGENIWFCPRGVSRGFKDRRLPIIEMCTLKRLSKDFSDKQKPTV